VLGRVNREDKGISERKLMQCLCVVRYKSYIKEKKVLQNILRSSMHNVKNKLFNEIKVKSVSLSAFGVILLVYWGLNLKLFHTEK
jgi:hypothetical protein